MCGFSSFGCCGCHCDPVFLTLNDGVSWVPTANKAETPFYFGFNIENLNHAGLGDSVIRLMARVESTEADDLAVIGNHCFAEIRRSDDLIGVTSLDTQPAIWVRIGVCIDGVDTILNSGTGIVSLKPLGFRLGIKFGSGLASSTGQIKLASATNLPLASIASSPNFREGDYFLARAAITLSGSPSNLAAAKGKLYRLVDVANASNPASWIDSPLSELDDPFLYCGSGDYNPASLLSTGTSIYQSDAAEPFASLPGRYESRPAQRV